jgi:hypothetical protein
MGTGTYLALARAKLAEIHQRLPEPGLEGPASGPAIALEPQTEPPVSIVPLPTGDSTTEYEIDELNEIRVALPCPACRQPLDGFRCCWRCRGRLCGSCGRWMRGQPYAIACAECLQARFARLAAGVQQPPRPTAQVDNPRLHPCPECAAQGRQRQIPALWQRCAVCEAARPVVLPVDVWSDDDARALIAAGLRRVSVAWAAWPPEQRDPALQERLAGAALLPIHEARQRQDMLALRRALAAYEEEARPLFAAARLSAGMVAAIFASHDRLDHRWGGLHAE